MPDPFARPIPAIDRELADQVEKRDKATNELLHALFVIERTGLVIDRLLAERAYSAKREPVRSR